jgi:hypothetical protein
VLERLIDHAALFPPASMSLPDALAEDRRARESPHAALLNRFVVPAARLAELPKEGPPLSVVLAAVDDAALVEGAERVEAVELRLSSPRPESAELLAAYRALGPLGVESYFELVFDEGWRDSVPAAIGAVAAVGGRVKLRCGGEVVPSVQQAALVIACCREAGVPFKATAGLHHAVRHGDEHGFLNLLAAATAPRGRIEAVLAEEDAGALELDEAAREVFVSFGSCSWSEPVDDLRALGLLG